MKKSPITSLLVALLMLSLLLTYIKPTGSWIYPDCTEDDAYEKFGPRVDRLLIKLYATEDAEWDDMETGAVDITDWPLSYERRLDWESPPQNQSLKTISYGAEFGIFVLDINNNWTQPDGTPNPTREQDLRHALAHLIDRFTMILAGMIPMWTMNPPVYGAYSHPEIVPGGALEWMTHPYNVTEARRILNASANFYFDPYPTTLKWTVTGQPVTLDFYTRVDHAGRTFFGDRYELELPKIGITVNRIPKDSMGCYLDVMVAKHFNLHTGYWSTREDPDHAPWLYGDLGYWHPGFCYNYGHYNDEEVNYWGYKLIAPNTPAEAILASHKLQEAMANTSDIDTGTAIDPYTGRAFPLTGCLGAFPLYQTEGYKAIYRTYTGGNPYSPPAEEAEYVGQSWKGIVNIPGYGVDNRWTFLNAYPEGHPMGRIYDASKGNMTMRWGFKVDRAKLLNPLYSSGWDWKVLELIYDSLIVRDAYTKQWMPWMAKNYTIGTWTSPVTGETLSKITFVLRPDLYWHDGTQVTAEDVLYTFITMDKELTTYATQPWWHSSALHMLSAHISDPYTIEILMDVKSIYALSWCSMPVLPKHIWKPMIEKVKSGEWTADDIMSFSPDQNLIGSGPFRLQDYVELSHITLIANKPMTTVQTNLVSTPTGEPSTPITSTKGYFAFSPVHINVHADSPYYQQSKIPPWDPVTFTLTQHLMWLNKIPNTATGDITGQVWVNKYVWLVYPDGTEELIKYEHNKTLYACEPDVETLGPFTFEPCYHAIKVALHVKGPPTITVSKEGGTIVIDNPWISHWNNFTYHFWVTIPPDITGGRTTQPYFDDVASVAARQIIYVPDCSVDIYDLGIMKMGFGAYPGHERWNEIGDINGDQIINGRDVLTVEINYGWGWSPPEPWPSPQPVHLIADTGGKTVVCRNYNCTVDIRIVNVTNLWAYDIRLNYNSTVIELVAWEITPPFVGSVYEVPGYIAVSALGGLASPFTGNATIAKLTFTAIAKGNTTIDPTPSDLISSSPFGPIPFTAFPAEVKTSMPGDITGGTDDPWDFVPDGKVDGRDLFPVKKGFGAYPGIPVGPEYPIWHPNSDISNDGQIDGQDVYVIQIHFGEAS